jgi:hypothetical protein
MAGFLDTLFSGGAEKEAADKNRALAQQYGTDAQGYLTGGYNTGTANLGQAIGAYQPLADLGAKYNMGGDLWRNALGINGAPAAQQAQQSFVNNPGYQAAVDAGLTGINRSQALRGQVNSGNTDVDALTFSQNLQNQQYNNWLNNLQASGQSGIGLIGSAAQGQAGGYTNLANLAQQYAQNQTGVAGNVTQGMVGANNLQAQGEATGAKNLLGTGLAIAGMVAGGPIGAGLSSGLSSAFSGGGSPSTGATFGGYGGGTPGSGMMGGIRYPAF